MSTPTAFTITTTLEAFNRSAQEAVLNGTILEYMEAKEPIIIGVSQSHVMDTK